MNGRRAFLAALLTAIAFAAAPAAVVGQRSAAPVGLPARLSNQEFWRMVQDFSEPEGFFDSDNLVSNEDTFQTVIPELVRTVKPGRAYLGVGPDQNFAYIIALDPRLSFITDVRRGNLHVLLMYKALIEQSSDRADFLSRLFSRARPAGLSPDASAAELLRAYTAARPDRARFDQNLAAIVDTLTKRHGFALAGGDVPGITSVYASFFNAGPSIAFVSSRPGNRYPSYTELQTSTDADGVNRGYLSNEDRFRLLKTDEEENRIVPLVGNFAGPKTLRAVGKYLRDHDATVGAFYTSNVEQYLFQDGIWDDFMANVSALPLDPASTFIRSCFNSCSSPSGSRAVTLLDSMVGLERDREAGRIRRYGDVLLHSHPR